MGASAIVQPWNDLESALGRGSYYGANDRSGDPIRDAPANDPAGGIIYFDSEPDRKQLTAALQLLDVQLLGTGYAVFASESEHPIRDRYLAQIRIVAFDAMSMFGAVPDPGDQPWRQQLSVGALIEAFIDAQQRVWGPGMSSQLRGTLGGDGDWAREKLSSGFMVENGSNGIYRLWSRPWLVTK